MGLTSRGGRTECSLSNPAFNPGLRQWRYLQPLSPSLSGARPSAVSPGGTPPHAEHKAGFTSVLEMRQPGRGTCNCHQPLPPALAPPPRPLSLCGPIIPWPKPWFVFRVFSPPPGTLVFRVLPESTACGTILYRLFS